MSDRGPSVSALCSWSAAVAGAWIRNSSETDAYCASTIVQRCITLGKTLVYSTCSSRLPTWQVDAASAPATRRQRLTTGTLTARAVSAASAAALHSSPKAHYVYIAHHINGYMLQTLIGAFTCRERYHKVLPLFWSTSYEYTDNKGN